MDSLEGGEALGQQLRPEDGEAEMTEFRDVSSDQTVQGYTPTKRLGDDSSNEVEWNTVLNQDDEPDDGLEEITIGNVRSMMDDVLLLEHECEDTRFIRWLIKHKSLSIERTRGDYTFSYYGEDQQGNTTWFPLREFQITDGELDGDGYALARVKLRGYYDDWADYEEKG